MKSITQNMRYLQSLMSYAQRYGVKAASRKYNRARSFIYFWRKRWDGSVESLQCQSRRLHAHPNQHTEEELKLIRNMRRRNPDLGIIELWCRLRERGYSRCVESLYRVMKREGLMPQKKKVKKYTPKPYRMWKCPTCGREFRNTNQHHYCGKAPETVDEYILAQDENVREYLQRIRSALKSALPDTVEKISWSMPTYWNGHNIIHFAASKKHIGLYPGPEAVAHFAEKLDQAGCMTSKGTIRIPWSEHLPLEL